MGHLPGKLTHAFSAVARGRRLCLERVGPFTPNPIAPSSGVRPQGRVPIPVPLRWQDEAEDATRTDTG